MGHFTGAPEMFKLDVQRSPPLSSAINMQLPLEVWRQILFFLDDYTVKELYSLNRALFQLSMDARYREIKFERLNGGLIHRLNTLKNTDFAKRVQCIHLAPHIFSDQDDDGQVSPEEASQRKSRFRKFGRLLFGTRVSSKQQHNDPQNANQVEDDSITGAQLLQIRDDLASVVPHLENVQTFVLSWTSVKEVPASYLDLCWKSFDQNLTELDLTVTTTKAATMFPLPPSFPHLESLKLHILGRNSIVECQTSLSSFVNSLHTTLKKIRVRSTPVRNISGFYLSLGYFNTLTSVDIDISTDGSFKSSEPPGYATFLDQQNKILEDLVLYMPPEHSNTLWRLGLEETRLAKLERLSISAPLVDQCWDHSMRFARGHIRTLTEFSTEGQMYPGRLNVFLETFHHKNPYSLLTRLSFYALHLDAKLIDHLASGLSRLESLKLAIGSVSTNGKSLIIPSESYPQGPNGEHAFTRGLRAFDSLRRWNLNDITIKRRSCCGELYLWGLMQACARFIPSISSFVGSGDMDVPIPANRIPHHSSTNPCKYGFDSTQ